MRAQKLARDGQQIIKQQQERATQMHDHDLLGRCQLCLQAVRRVRVVAKNLSLLPLVDGLFGDAVALGQDGRGFCAGSDLGAHGWCGTGVLVQSGSL